MEKKIMTKAVATVLAFILTFSNVILLGIYTNESIAASINLEEQDKAVENAKIEFDAYFEDEGKSKHSKDIDMAKNSEMLYLSIKVTEGYLSDGVIKVQNSNFKFVETDEVPETVQKVDEKTNSVTLNQINKGESVLLKLPIKMNTDSDFDVKNIDKVSSVTLTGTYVNTSGKEIKVSKTMEVEAKMTSEAKANIEATITKFVPVNTDNKKGTLLQVSVNSNLAQDVMPIKQTSLNIEIPEINDVEPEKIVVSAKSTKSTNGEEEKVFVNDLDYKIVDGKIELLIKNVENTNGIISWIKDNKDQIILTYIYGEEASVSQPEVKINISSAITLYDGLDTTVNGNVTDTISLENKIGEVISYDVETNKNEISKGYMEVTGAGIAAYSEKWYTDISNVDLLDSINIEENSKYIDNNKNQYLANIPFVSTKISERNFMEILGEEGYINIFNNDGEKISTLNKENLVYNYAEETTYIKVETSKPISEGLLILENERQLKPLEYDKAQTELFNTLLTRVICKAVSEGSDIYTAEKVNEIKLTDPATKIEASINKPNLSTTEANEAVEVRIVLDTSDAKTLLYKNPKIKIEFPKYVTSFENAKMGLLYGQGLELNFNDGIKQYKNQDGGQVFEIEVIGEQETYNTSSVSNGAVYILQATLGLDELTPAIKDNIKVTVTNENTNVEQEIQVKYAAEKKVLAKNTVSVFAKAGVSESISSLDEIKTLTIEPSEKTQVAKISADVVNSTGNEIEEARILGRIPFKGNKSVSTNADLGSGFDTVIYNKLVIDNQDIEADIYYSENENATSNLELTSNGWTKNPSNYKNMKSYLVVLNNPMEAGEKVSYTYSIQVPANVEGELETYESHAVYYKADETLKVQEATKIGLATSKIETAKADDGTQTDGESTPASTLTASVAMSSAGKTLKATDTVKEGQYVDYTVTMKNTSNKDMTFDIKVAKENGNFYGLAVYGYTGKGTPACMYFEENSAIFDYVENTYVIGVEDGILKESITIKAGETYTYDYCIVAKKDTAGSNLTSTISFINGNEKIADDITTSNAINDGNLKVNLVYNVPEADPAFSGRSMPFKIDVTNLTNKKLSNVVVEMELPSLLTYVDNYIIDEDSGYDSKEVNGQKLKFIINSLDANAKATVFILANIGSLDDTEEARKLSFIAKATADNEVSYSNMLNKPITQGESKVVASMKANVTDEYVEDDQEIIFSIDIQNKGSIAEPAVEFLDRIPTGLLVQNYTITEADGKETTITTSQNTITAKNYELQPNESMNIKIVTKVMSALAEKNTISNKATISGEYFEKYDTNTITYKLNKNASSDPTDPLNPGDAQPGDTENGFSLSGAIWKDENLNGRRDMEENGIGGIQVKLMNNKKSEFVKDDNGKEIATMTESDGSYEFTGLKSGEYVVVYVYDSNIYEPTTYQKDGVGEDSNSDAIASQVKINGTNATVGTTDIISVGQASLENIDLGLIQTKVFDLKLEKKVSTIIVQNKQGTHTYKQDTDFSKLEIPAKYMTGTKLTIEYKITVKNEGNVQGRVLKIVDYIPNDLEFKAEVNNEWYKGTDGNLYTTEFENDVIKPGETKEITLVLTKELKEEAAEITSNTAEIAETYNALGLEDNDSKLANNAQDEDDFGKADLLVTIKTGVMTYVSITIGAIMLIGVLGTGIYLIKKKVLPERI